MSAPASYASGSARRSRWIPWLFVGGFGVVLLANGIMITVAVGTFSGLTTSEPYTKGLRFNEQLRQVEAQERLGWHVHSRFRPTRARAGDLELQVTDRTGTGIAGARIMATFARPLERKHDFTVALEALGGGRYGVNTALPLSGLWVVRYRIERDGNVLEASERIEVE